jgi:hypothetical protein
LPFLGWQNWLTRDGVDAVMAVATMVRFCNCGSRQQHDHREQEGFFHILIIVGVSGIQTILVLRFITSWDCASHSFLMAAQLPPSIPEAQFSPTRPPSEVAPATATRCEVPE